MSADIQELLGPLVTALYPCYLFILACLLVALMLRPTITSLASAVGCPVPGSKEV